MHVINIHEAKTHFSKLIEAAIQGEETIIAKAGKPVARLLPMAPTKVKRKFGLLKGKIKIKNNFDDPLPGDILADFEGK